MFEQILYYVAYVLALSLQLSAGLLLVGNTNIARKGIIREYCARHTAIAFDEKGKLLTGADIPSVKSRNRQHIEYKKHKIHQPEQAEKDHCGIRCVL